MLKEQLEAAQQWYALYPQAFQAAALVFALGVLFYLFSVILGWKRNRRNNREVLIKISNFFDHWERTEVMHRGKMKEYRSVVADLIVDTFEDAVHKDKLTRDLANELYGKIAFQLGVWDLHPRRLTPRAPDPGDLKDQIRARLMNGDHHHIPDPDRPVDELESIVMSSIKQSAM